MTNDRHRPLPRGAPSRLRAGFTLLELLVVMAIIGILAGLASLYLVHNNTQAQARSFMDGLAQDINLARSTAMARSQSTEVLFTSASSYQVINLEYVPGPRVLVTSQPTTVTLSGVATGDAIICRSGGFCFGYDGSGALKTIASISASGNGVTRTLSITALGLTRLE